VGVSASARRLWGLRASGAAGGSAARGALP
jgi:hypothetical protein